MPRNLLIQLDTSSHPSTFDQVVAYDAGADVVLSYGGVTVEAVRDLVHGAIFTRGPKDLLHTAIFIGGTDIGAGEQLLDAVTSTFFGPMRVSVMLDSNGANTTAVAAVARLRQATGILRERRVLVVAGSGPVGTRAAGLLAKAGAAVTVTSRRAENGELGRRIAARFGGTIQDAVLKGPADAETALHGAELLLNAGPAGVQLVPKNAWLGRDGLLAAVDLNAVPPVGIDGIEVTDNGVARDGTTTFGALGVGGLKMKIHKACIARLFQRNDLVLDVEAIADIADSLSAPAS